MERRDLGDLCKAELKGLGDCLEVSRRQESRMRFQQCAWWSLRSVFNNIWTEQTQGCPLLQPPTSFPVTTFGISHSAVLRHLGQPIFFFFFFFKLKILYYLSTMSSWIPQTNSSEVEAVIRQRVNLHLHASYTYLSLGFFFNLHNVALVGLGHFFFPTEWCRSSKRESGLLEGKPVL